MKKKRWILIILLVLIIVILAAVWIFSDIENNLNKLSNTPIKNIDLGAAADGVYTGSYGSVPVSAKVSVTVKDHQITKVDLIEHNNGKGQPAEIITQRIVEAQSLDVDIISGATYSSKVILKAVEIALSGAE